MNKHIFVITYGDSQTPSTKYRILQYEDYFREHGITLECIYQKDLNTSHLEKISKADLVINQKCLLNRHLSKKIISHSSHLLFDFDDSIYTRPGRPYSWLTDLRIKSRMKFWLKHAHVVTTANVYLKNYASQFTDHACVIPMALDLQRWVPKKRSASNQVKIGWSGAPVNLHHIERLEPILADLLDQNPDLSLSIYSGRRPKLKCKYSYTPFEEGTEAAFIQDLDIGLLPLTDEEFSRGKSPLKAIQYLSCGVPVIGNVFGATAEILNKDNSIAVYTDNDWTGSLQRLLKDPLLRKNLGEQGRQHSEKHHDTHFVQKDLLDLLRKCIIQD